MLVVLSTLILFTEILYANHVFTHHNVYGDKWQCTLAKEDNFGAMNALLPGVQHNVGVECYSAQKS